MRKAAIVFPGQGSQFVGMGKELFENSQTVRDYFQSANEILGKDLAKIMFEGPEETLQETDNTQVAIFLVSISLLDIIKKQDYDISFYAGHSLGEITAYYASGVFDFATALKVIKKRGQAMLTSYLEPAGMAAVIGADLNLLEIVVAEVNKTVPVFIANYNSLEQIVISGSLAGVEAASTILKEKGIRKIIPLKVKGPFHTPLMQKASSEFSEFLESISFISALKPIILNRTAQAETNITVLKENLPLQICSSVKWLQSVNYLADKVDCFIECGPGKVLTGLIKKIAKDKEVFGV
ncbi:MAG: ACP S-malonyltransferase [Candidatus Margulisiibacteriota bacterium]|jgi:[acyl-carrier-protein] S-malonyltransferase